MCDGWWSGNYAEMKMVLAKSLSEDHGHHTNQMSLTTIMLKRMVNVPWLLTDTFDSILLGIKTLIKGRMGTLYQ